jgi:hypothetical protein
MVDASKEHAKDIGASGQTGSIGESGSTTK